MKKLVPFFFSSLFLCGGEYDFDFEAIEVKPYEYGGYLKGEHKFMDTKEGEENYYNAEGDLKFKYFKESWTFDGEFIANYTDDGQSSENQSTVLSSFVSYKQGVNHIGRLGKISLKWGKGYFANPVAFLEKVKDPNDPEASKEGFILVNYKYNKSLDGDLKNYSLDVAVTEKKEDLNEDLDGEDSVRVGVKGYLLWYDTDIDLVYLYDEKGFDKIGLDFSKNLQTNFEIHGEIAQTNSDENRHLLGIKYLTEFELTVTAEYICQNEEQARTNPFFDNRYIVSKFSQKEPLGWLYGTVYFKNLTNMDDESFQNGAGVTYDFKNSVNLDISYGKNSGDTGSQYGSKKAGSFLWTKIYRYF